MSSTYTTKQGDMWDLIAKRVYGDEYLLHKLMDANPDDIETVIFSAGVVLTVPDVSSASNNNLPPWKKASS